MLNYRCSGLILLECVLILMVIGAILIMSVRYYKDASNQTQLNSILASLHGVNGDIERFIGMGLGNGLSGFRSNNLTNTTSVLGKISVSGIPTTSQVYVAFSFAPSTAVCDKMLQEIMTKNTNWRHTRIGGDCVTFSYIRV